MNTAPALHVTPKKVSGCDDLITLASVTARIGKALVEADRLPPSAARAELLRKIATEARVLSGHIERLAAHDDPHTEPAVVVVTCRHCGDEQPTPINWAAPCRACGGER